MVKVLFNIGIVFMIISGISLGAWSNVQDRKSFNTLSTRFGLYSGLVGMVLIGIALLVYYLSE
ncbi:hypothetical protein V7122_00420 [Bacillus sp. JJ1532]|uniref:hypothetical protein n=1 Tax=unclassified Bacillus (in: firmicutes) TaxID=185979 RepID=UPI002FFEB082